MSAKRFAAALARNGFVTLDLSPPIYLDRETGAQAVAILKDTRTGPQVDRRATLAALIRSRNPLNILRK